jgi:hypothetical protein
MSPGTDRYQEARGAASAGHVSFAERPRGASRARFSANQPRPSGPAALADDAVDNRDATGHLLLPLKENAMDQPELRNFEDFWPYYVRQHQSETNRTLHVVGTTLALGSLAAGLLTRRVAFFLAAPVLGYGLAWVGHFFVEGNTPATFSHPLWSLRGDVVMWWKTVNGTMRAEVERVATSNGVPGAGETKAAAPQAN